MKVRALLLFAFFGLALCGHTQTLVQHKMATEQVNPTFTSNVTAGNTIVCVNMDFSNSGGTGTGNCSDNDANAYTCSTQVSDATNLFSIRLCYVCNPTLTTNPPTISNSWSGSVTRSIIDIREYANLQCVSDGQTGSTSSNTTALTTNSITSTVMDLVLAAFWGPTGSLTSTGLTNVDTQNGTYAWSVGDVLNSAPGSKQGTATLSSSSALWGGGVFALKDTFTFSGTTIQ